MFDFDIKGREIISKLLNRSSSGQTIPIKEVNDKILNKENLTFNFKSNCNGYNNITLIMLTPSKNDTKYWNNYSNYEIEHLYNIEKYNNTTILMKIDKDNNKDNNEYSFLENPEKFKPVNDKKIDFASHVSKHPKEYDEVFKGNFKRMFEIIDKTQNDT